MQSAITVYSVNTGGKDKPIKGRLYFDYDRFTDPRRNSRVPKMLAHQFVDTEYSIYLDGNCSLLKPAQELVDLYLKDHDLAVFIHPKRDCIYDEATKCAVSKLDDPEVIIKQVSRYEKEGYAKHKGLCECMMILRRHTKKVEEFNNTWFSEWVTGSVRDQISFMYSVNKVGLRINVIDLPWRVDTEGNGLRGDFFKIVPHIIVNPPVV